MKFNVITRIVSVFLLLLLPVSSWAENYDEYARRVREEVWSWSLPEFEKRDIPDEYKNESAVLLAVYNRLNATGKNKFNWGKFMMATGAISKEIIAEEVYRAMVRINDKAALDEFSEFDYQMEKKQMSGMSRNRQRIVFGARIIKPDGTVHEVDPDEAVNVTRGKKDKEDRQKLAIPDLQIGDILDYFFHEEIRLEDARLEPYIYCFVDRYPILNYTVHCEIARKLTTEYRSMNGAPRFIESSDADGNIVLDATAANLPKQRDASLWYVPMRQSPMICMNVLDNNLAFEYKPKNARKSGVYGNLPVAAVQQDAFYLMDRMARDNYISCGYMVNKVRKMAKQYQKSHPGITEQQLMDYLYEALIFNWPSDPNYGSKRFVVCLHKLMESFDLSYMVGLVTGRNMERMDDLFQMYDVSFLLMRKGDKKAYMYPDMYDASGVLPDGFEGEPVVLIPAKNMDYGAGSLFLKDTLPASLAVANQFRVKMDVSLKDDNPLELSIERNMELTGGMKAPFQNLLLNYEDWDKAMRRRLEIPASLIEEYTREHRKYVDNLIERLEEDRKGLKKSYLTEVAIYHEQEPKEIMTYRLVCPGVVADSAVLVYDVKYVMENMVKKAGENLLLSIGQLIGCQLNLNENGRNRTEDVYMPCARLFNYEITFTLPDGYHINEGSLDKLKVNVRNRCGFFTSDIVLTDRKLVMKIQKQYMNAYEPVSHWPQLLELIDATSGFYSQVMVLRK